MEVKKLFELALIEQKKRNFLSAEKLYKKILKTKSNFTIDKFLINNSDLRHVVRRAFIVEKFPYSEIQDNTISEKTIPIDMLRLKLSFFGLHLLNNNLLLLQHMH